MFVLVESSLSHRDVDYAKMARLDYGLGCLAAKQFKSMNGDHCEVQLFRPAVSAAGLATIGFFLALGVLIPFCALSSASAEQGVACVNDGDYGQNVGVEQPNQTYSDDSRGTRSQVWVAAGAACQRISSVYVRSSNLTGSFEFGYLIGYSNCSPYRNHFYTEPTLFFWAINSDGSLVSCGVFSDRHPTSKQYDAFRVSDTNGNTYWGSYFNGNELQSSGVDMNFSKGYNWVATERGAAADDGYTRFNNLAEYHDSNGWTSWDNAVGRYDTDPDYDVSTPDANTVIVDN
ncbi:MAG: hypothetical protein QM638_00255 [Nocardioides sp.]|uniref:hypothetical protein n=1 Tax=Nocardioides sp. TaxID=35761 RepID=UPI0039E3C77B